jgi:hypothetical protein
MRQTVILFRVAPLTQQLEVAFEGFVSILLALGAVSVQNSTGREVTYLTHVRLNLNIRWLIFAVLPPASSRRTAADKRCCCELKTPVLSPPISR